MNLLKMATTFLLRHTVAAKFLSQDEILRRYFGWAGGGASTSGEIVTDATALAVSAVYACVRVASETLGALPCIVYRKRPDGGKERLYDHPLWSLLHDRPNSYQTAMEFFEMMQGFVELRGNAYAYITRVRRQPRELIPIHPDRCHPEQDDFYRISYLINDLDGTQRRYPAKDILHIKFLSHDGVTGITPIHAQRDVIGVARAQDKHGGNMFKNATRPSGILQMEGVMKSDEAYKRLQDNWTSNYSGDGVGKIAILEEGLKFTPMGMTAEDAQFIESKKFSRSEIGSIFRIPPHKIGDLEKATFSNIEHQGVEFVTDSMLPRAKRWEQRIKAQLIEEEDVYVEFLMDALLRGDTKTRVFYYNNGIQNGYLSPNEARLMENREPYEGGDEFKPAENLYGKQDKTTDEPRGDEEGADDEDRRQAEQSQQ